MVMEYLEGGDLSSVRRQRQPLPVHVAAEYVFDACVAFGEAHRLGIVHRDFKPANLFLARRAGGKTRVKVLDFGISKMAAADASRPASPVRRRSLDRPSTCRPSRCARCATSIRAPISGRSESRCMPGS